MVKLIQGRAWYCCPVCNKKMFQVKDGAACRGVMLACKQCGNTREVIISGYHEIKEAETVSNAKSRIFVCKKG